MSNRRSRNKGSNPLIIRGVELAIGTIHPDDHPLLEEFPTWLTSLRDENRMRLHNQLRPMCVPGDLASLRIRFIKEFFSLQWVWDFCRLAANVQSLKRLEWALHCGRRLFPPPGTPWPGDPGEEWTPEILEH